MARDYYQPGEKRASSVSALFARIASRYDLINDIQSFGLHRYWKRQVIRLARPGVGCHALDVCCGTGDIALAMALAGAETTGLDFSAPMLAVATRRNRLQSHARVRFQEGDALHLPFPDSTFDVVTVGYGLRNLASWEQGLAEMVRVARPGGRVLVLDFGKPDNRVWRSLYYLYLRLCVPVLGLVFCGSASAYSYILDSLKHYPAQHGVAAGMTRLGLQRTEVINFLGGVMTINYGEKPGRAEP